MSGIKKILLGVIIIFIAIQFIKPPRNKSGQALPKDITKMYRMPDTVQTVLKNACYDCHSNKTAYPWYVNIQPMGWLMAKHIRNGKADLNLSEFGSYSPRRQTSKLRSIANSIKDGTMPLPSYTWMHKNARLTKNEKAVVIDWVTKTKDSLSIKK